jgi:hypothetical protein
MPVKTEKHITRAMLKAAPDTLFVFGDNMVGRGFGGQAKEMRGEPNAVGIPTKLLPGMGYTDFFRDTDIERAKPKIEAAFVRLFAHAAHGGNIVWPEDGIGTGLAELPTRAPAIWKMIETNRVALFASR